VVGVTNPSASPIQWSPAAARHESGLIPMIFAS
jgi:hypothetical protein